MPGPIERQAHDYSLLTTPDKVAMHVESSVICVGVYLVEKHDSARCKMGKYGCHLEGVYPESRTSPSDSLGVGVGARGCRGTTGRLNAAVSRMIRQVGGHPG